MGQMEMRYNFKEKNCHIYMKKFKNFLNITNVLRLRVKKYVNIKFIKT